MPVIRIPAVISETGGSKKVDVGGETVLEALRAHTEENGPELEENVLEDDKIKEYINVYVNGKDVRDREGVDTPVEDDDEIRIIPAASGG
jgi:molybdopterin converting factor small subunit